MCIVLGRLQVFCHIVIVLLIINANTSTLKLAYCWFIDWNICLILSPPYHSSPSTVHSPPISPVTPAPLCFLFRAHSSLKEHSLFLIPLCSRIRCTPNTDLVLSWILSLPFILRTHFSATDDHTDHPYVLSTCYTSLMGCQEISNASNKKSIISSKIPLIPSENPGLLMHSWPVKHA